MIKVIGFENYVRPNRKVNIEVEALFENAPFQYHVYSNVEKQELDPNSRIVFKDIEVIDPGIGEISQDIIYTAPSFFTSETIYVGTTGEEDRTDPERSFTVHTVSPLGVFAGIIRNQLGLDIDQVHIYNQEFIIPPDERLYVTVGLTSSKNFSTNSQSTSIEALLDVNIFGKKPRK